MTKVPKRRIQEIMTIIDCPEKFACYKSGFDNLCRQPIVEHDNPSSRDSSRCTRHSDRPCKMRVSSRSSYCCKCPLRLYVAAYLNNLAALEGGISESPPEHTDPKD